MVPETAYEHELAQGAAQLGIFGGLLICNPPGIHSSRRSGSLECYPAVYVHEPGTIEQLLDMPFHDATSIGSVQSHRLHQFEGPYIALAVHGLEGHKRVYALGETGVEAYLS